MKDLRNDKAQLSIAAFAIALALLAFFLQQWKLGGFLMAMAVVMIVIWFQTKRREKSKKGRYHAVHWQDGRVVKDDKPS